MAASRARYEQYRDVRTNALDKQAESKKRSTIYSTKKIEQIMEDIKGGNNADMNPFFHGDTDYRDSGVPFEYTDEELEELEKCSRDVIYFATHYAKFLNDKGRTLVKLRDYQIDVLHLMGDEVWSEEL